MIRSRNQVEARRDQIRQESARLRDIKRVRERAYESKTPIERAAIAACRVLNRGECGCAAAPSVCELMVKAATAAILTER